MSELTLIEFRANVTTNVRRTDAQCVDFDLAWADRARALAYEQIASGRIDVLRLPRHAAEHALLLVDLATEEHNQQLGAWDAMHLLTAAAWAHAEGSAVFLYTSDDDYVRVTGLYPQFARFVEVFDLNRMQGPFL